MRPALQAAMTYNTLKHFGANFRWPIGVSDLASIQSIAVSVNFTHLAFIRI